MFFSRPETPMSEDEVSASVADSTCAVNDENQEEDGSDEGDEEASDDEVYEVDPLQELKESLERWKTTELEDRAKFHAQVREKFVTEWLDVDNDWLSCCNKDQLDFLRDAMGIYDNGFIPPYSPTRQMPSFFEFIQNKK